MKESIDINIKIADAKPITLTVRRDEEAFVRQVVYDVNRLYATLEARYAHGRTPHELLAMAVYYFAKGYKTLQTQQDGISQALSDFEHELDTILLDVG